MDEFTRYEIRRIAAADWWTPSGCTVAPAPPERRSFSRRLLMAERKRVATPWDTALAGAGYRQVSLEEIDSELGPGVVRVDLYRAARSQRLWVVVRAVNLNHITGEVHVEAEHAAAFGAAYAARRAKNDAKEHGGWTHHQADTGEVMFVLPVAAGFVTCSISEDSVEGILNRRPVKVQYNYVAGGPGS